MKKLITGFFIAFFAVTFVSAQSLDNVKFELGMGGKKKGYYNTTQLSLLMGNKEVSGGKYYYPGWYNYEKMLSSAYYPEPQNLTSSVYYPGYQYNYATTELKLIPSITMVNGYMFNEHWSVGIGLGIEILEYNTYPVFAEIKYTLWDKKISPYFNFKGGYSVADLKAKHYDGEKTIDFYPYQVFDYDVQNFGGMMVNPEIGVKIGLSNNADLLISAGYRYQKLASKAEQSYTYDSQEYFNRYDSKQDLNRVVFGLAVMFK